MISLGAKSLLLSRLCYMETIVEKSGVCSAILLLLLGSTSQLLNPIKYLPFPNKRRACDHFHCRKSSGKEKRESYRMQHVEQTILLLSLFDGTKPPSVTWCTGQCPGASQALQGEEGQVPSWSLFLHRVYGILVSATQKWTFHKSDADSCTGIIMFISKKLL